MRILPFLPLDYRDVVDLFLQARLQEAKCGAINQAEEEGESGKARKEKIF